MEDANSLPPLGLTPVMDTQSEGAETSSENGQQATSEETVHPDGAPSTDGDSSTTDASTEEAPFHVEGKQIFKTKEDYVTHVNKQRGAASRLAHEKALAEQTAKHYETLYKAALDAVGKPAAQVAKEPEMTEETQAALKTLEAAGFIKADQMKAMLDEAIRPFRADSEQRFQEKVQEARTTVDNFIGLNPDAADHAVAIENTLLTMEKAGLPGGLDQAYYLVTGKLPKSPSASEAEIKREVKQIKAAQAGGAPASKAGTAARESDIFDGMLSSVSSSLI